MSARLDVLHRATDELRTGSLPPELCAEAVNAAHKLAGAVGSFGYGRSSLLARRAEKILRAGAHIPPEEAAHELAGLVADMRADMSLDAGPATPDAPAGPKPGTLPLVTVVASNLEVLNELRVQAGRRGLRAAPVMDLALVADRVRRDGPEAIVLHLQCAGAELCPPLELLEQLHREAPTVPVVVAGGDGSLAERMAVAERGAAAYALAGAAASELMEQAVLALQRKPIGGERVLALTDDPGLVAELRDGLEGVAELVPVSAPAEVWGELGRVTPSVVAIDARMPGANVRALCGALRNDGRWAVIPVVAVVGDRSEVVAALAAGADDCLVLPVDRAEVGACVGARIRHARHSESLAATDRLTGLANRVSAAAALGNLIRLAERLGKRVCIAQLDLDGLGVLNEQHGHAVGDAALRRLGERVRAGLRSEDVVARWAGDRVVIGLFGTDCDRGVDRCTDLLTQWRDDPLVFDGQPVATTFSAGVAEYPADGNDLETVLGAAEKALRSAKTGGRDLVVGSSGAHRTTQQVDVAIVEDEEAAADLMTHGLEARGLRVWRFSNGASAVQMLAGSRPRVRARVILLDLNLPAVDGMELLTLLGRDGVLRSSRVIVVSATDYPQVISQARDLGASDYVVKPVTVEDLGAKVDGALGRRPTSTPVRIPARS